jgi:hypothetical protein
MNVLQQIAQTWNGLNLKQRWGGDLHEPIHHPRFSSSDIAWCFIQVRYRQKRWSSLARLPARFNLHLLWRN